MAQPVKRRVRQVQNSQGFSLREYDFRRFNQKTSQFRLLGRPHPGLTTVPANGDLWDKTRLALYQLLDFNNYVETLGAPT